MAIKMNPVVLIAVLLTFLVNFIHAAPFQTTQPNGLRSVLDNFDKVLNGVTALDNAVKVFNNKTDELHIRTLTYNVEWLTMTTWDHVTKSKDFNDKDSKNITAAHLKLGKSLGTMLGELVAKKDAIKKVNKSDFMFNNFESLHERIFPLSDALENKTTDPESKTIDAITDHIDKAFESSLKQLL
ncbi:uncharacterized protein KD926_000673 [Aspergillus affinis]|uniref:uncharacterized protein n=1 Tax=Aspergillus affinis TaxID=1070780 RepID=UPI0022FEEA90|nr:uncharacterized protein KD926_000673 [Aspergillus affinis]KAI9037236.1 hypothetical protein KD926_000673 [Aspergillus affinis]